MKTDHFLNFKNYSKDILTSIIERGLELKRMKKLPNSLKNKSLGLIFEMPSTRTRVSFERGVCPRYCTCSFFNARCCSYKNSKS